MIYLDNNATTGLDPRVLTAMMEELSPIPANPSSAHAFGQKARSKLVLARKMIAGFFNLKESEVIFTSGGTESINTILRGIPPGHIISSDVEHSAVYNTLQLLEKKGFMVSFLPAGLYGAVRPEQVSAAIRPNTRLIMLSAANNETGVKIDLNAIAEVAGKAHIPFAVDGVALLGKEPFNLHPNISAMAFSGHKIHAPKGTGLLLLRNSFKIEPLLTGGDQEFGKRAGTENLSGIVGLAKAVELLTVELPLASPLMLDLRNRLEEGLRRHFPNLQINGEGPRLVNTANISFPGFDGETLLILLDQAGIAVSHGSACASGALEPSRVLLNMGIPKERARTSVRFSLSRWTTIDDIDRCIDAIVRIAKKS